MTKETESASTKAIFAVITALEPLAAEDRSRVLQSAGAFFGVAELPAASGGGPASTLVHKASGGEGGGAKPTGSVAGSGKKMSIVEFLDGRAPATNVQRIACFAYYRDKIEGQELFSSLELAPYFKQAKLAAPGSNYARDFNNAVREGWIHDDGPKSYLTRKGEQAVEAGFGGKTKPRGRNAGKKKRVGNAE